MLAAVQHDSTSSNSEQERAYIFVAGVAVVGDFARGTPPWLHDLIASCSNGEARTPQRTLAELHVHLDQVALMHVPQVIDTLESATAALALNALGRLVVQTGGWNELDFRSISLHVGERYTPSPPAPSVDAWLGVSGYTAVAVEDELLARWSRPRQDLAGTEADVVADITCHRSTVTLGKHSMHLVRALLPTKSGIPASGSRPYDEQTAFINSPTPEFLPAIEDISFGAGRPVSSQKPSVFVEGARDCSG
jgi:hypothetical protein